MENHRNHNLERACTLNGYRKKYSAQADSVRWLPGYVFGEGVLFWSLKAFVRMANKAVENRGLTPNPISQIRGPTPNLLRACTRLPCCICWLLTALPVMFAVSHSWKLPLGYRELPEMPCYSRPTADVLYWHTGLSGPGRLHTQQPVRPLR